MWLNIVVLKRMFALAKRNEFCKSCPVASVLSVRLSTVASYAVDDQLWL